MNPYLKPAFKPFPNQINNARELCRRRQALLTDRVGSGKTASILFAFAVLKAKGKVSNMLVLTPLSAYEKLVWKKDINKFTNFKCISFEDFLKAADNNPLRFSKLLQVYDIIYGKHTHVNKYASVVSDIFVKSPNSILCLDEVHAFKTPDSTLTTNLRLCSLRISSIWGVTGSTVSKNLEDFYNICNIIKPWYFGSFQQFLSTYCTTRQKVVGRFNGKLRKVLEITGVKDEALFERAIEPLVIKGESFLSVKFHYLDYELDAFEHNIYRRIAKGIDLDESLEVQDWFDFVMNNEVEDVPRIKAVNLYSSRFLYLQQSADGVLNTDGTQTRNDSVKLRMLQDKVDEIVSKGLSVLVYFDYYVSLEAAKQALLRLQSKHNFVILESTGDHTLGPEDLTEAKCEKSPHVVLCTKASAESASYYFINNVIFFHIPTTCATFTQFVGRITRKNTLFPDDLNCYIFRSSNIDLYKLMVVSNKAYQMELIQGTENNIPRDYMVEMTSKEMLDKAKKVLLWET